MTGLPAWIMPPSSARYAAVAPSHVAGRCGCLPREPMGVRYGQVRHIGVSASGLMGADGAGIATTLKQGGALESS